MEETSLQELEMLTAPEESSFDNAAPEESFLPEITETVNQNARSNVQIQNGVLSTTDSLTTADPNELYLFSPMSDTFFNFSIESPNPNYAMAFASVDYSTGKVTAIGVGVAAGGVYQLNGFPAGDWGLYVYSQDGSVGDDYTMKCNFANPAGVDTYYISSDYKQCIVRMKDSRAIYDNGNSINWSAINGVPIEWAVHTSWPAYNPNDPTNPGTEYLDMSIQEGKVKNIGYGSFNTNKRTVPHALFVFLNVDTLWTYKNSVVGAGDYHMTMQDLYGYDTPRRLNADDVRDPLGAPVCMIFNLDTRRYETFFSPLNLYFWRGGEKQTSGGFFGFQE